MLRIIVISLVVANLLLLGFQSSTPAVKPEARPASAKARDTGIPTIHLFSEMMEDQGLLSGNRRCFTLGPFHSVADWDDVHLRLQKVATRISERQTEALVERGYWVYMPPYPSLLEANEALLSLQALGLKDVAIIYNGEWKNSISLGYFMRQENAQRRKKALEDRGFHPMMRIQREAEPRFWLDYEQEPGAGLVELDMQNRPNDFMQRPVPCPEAEFLETEAVASQDTVENPVQAQALEEDAGPVTAGDEKPVRSTEQPAQAPDQPVQNFMEVDVETGAGLEAGNTTESAQVNKDGEEADADEKTASQSATEPEEAPGDGGKIEADQVQTTAADQVAGAPTAGEAARTTGQGVGTAANEVLDEATGSGDQPTPVEGTGDAATAEAETPPKQAVGTGPVDMVSIGPGQVETGVGGQDDEIPASGAPENENRIGDGGEEPTDEDKEDTVAAPSSGSGEQNAPGGTEKDNGNGTVDQR